MSQRPEEDTALASLEAACWFLEVLMANTSMTWTISMCFKSRKRLRQEAQIPFPDQVSFTFWETNNSAMDASRLPMENNFISIKLWSGGSFPQKENWKSCFLTSIPSIQKISWLISFPTFTKALIRKNSITSTSISLRPMRSNFQKLKAKKKFNSSKNSFMKQRTFCQLYPRKVISWQRLQFLSQKTSILTSWKSWDPKSTATPLSFSIKNTACLSVNHYSKWILSILMDFSTQQSQTMKKFTFLGNVPKLSSSYLKSWLTIWYSAEW